MIVEGARRVLSRVPDYHSWNDHDGNGARTTRVWRRLLGVEHTVIESVDLEPDGRGGELLIARVRPALDLGTTQVYLQATTRRVSCPTHGVVVAAVPWAVHFGPRVARRLIDRQDDYLRFTDDSRVPLLTG